MNRRISAIGVIGLFGIAALGLNSLKTPSTADDKSPQTLKADKTDSSGAEKPDQTERDRWMAVKLASGQQILEHLTSGDFQQLEVNARRMQVLNFLEQWLREEEFVHKSQYQGQLNAFEFATKELVRHAGDKNIDGALKAYVALTESCVRCHMLIRDVPRE